MPTYTVVFRNGENKKTGEELHVDALRIEVSPTDRTIKFLREDNPNKMFAAVVPTENVLYVKESTK